MALNMIRENDPEDKFNCVKILDVGFYKSSPCIVMALLCDNLYTVINEINNKFPVEKITKVA